MAKNKNGGQPAATPTPEKPETPEPVEPKTETVSLEKFNELLQNFDQLGLDLLDMTQERDELRETNDSFKTQVEAFENQIKTSCAKHDEAYNSLEAKLSETQVVRDEALDASAAAVKQVKSLKAVPEDSELTTREKIEKALRYALDLARGVQSPHDDSDKFNHGVLTLEKTAMVLLKEGLDFFDEKERKY